MEKTPRPDIERLDAIHRDALTVLALQSGPISRSAWQELLRQAGVVGAGGKAIHGDGMKGLIDVLSREGAVRATRYEHFDVDPVWMPRVLDAAFVARRLEPIATRLVTRHGWNRSDIYGTGSLSVVGDARRALAEGNASAIERAVRRVAQSTSTYEPDDWLSVLGIAPPRRWIERLPEPACSQYLARVLDIAFTGGVHVEDDVMTAAHASPSTEVRSRAVTVLALRGQLDEAEARSGELELRNRWEHGAVAFVALARGRWEQARRLFAMASAGTKGKYVEPPGYLAVFALLVAATDDTVPPTDLLKRLTKAKRALSPWIAAEQALEHFGNHRATGRSLYSHLAAGARPWIDALVVALVGAWTGLPSPRAGLAALSKQATSTGYAWLAARFDDLAQGRESPPSLLSLHVRRAAWDLALDALEGATGEGNAAGASAVATAPSVTVQWEIELLDWTLGMRVTPFLVSGRARSGKRVSVAHLVKNADLGLDERDKTIADTLNASTDRWDRDAPLSLLTLFINHPRVRDVAGKSLTVVRREPELRVEPTAGGARVEMHPDVFDASGLAVFRDGDELVVVSRTPTAARLSEVLGPGGLIIPKAGLARLHQTIAKLSAGIAVRAAEAFAPDMEAGDPRARVQLFRVGAGLRARVRVVPGGEHGAAFRPGHPPLEVVVAAGTQLRRVQRDAAAEREHAERLMDRCPILSSLPFEGDDRIARDVEVCLELLLELQAADAIVEWPEGQALRIPVTRTAAQVRVRVGGKGGWLELEGHIDVDEGKIVEMRDLLASASRASGRFLPIGDDQFLALTDDLRAKVEALARVQALGTKGHLSSALLPAIEGLVDGLDVTWTADTKRRRDAFAKAEQSTPRVPRALAAELRDYQSDGFQFLAKRADAGLGACLADDMGLGKTVQALALLLHRAAEGPALVVAPMTVCRNWEDEAARFAPTLRVVRLAEADREEAVREAKAGDLLLASYGLLVASEAIFTSRRWSTLVFDEAHALKNASTQRWKAARAVQADAIIALTGTPVENHVGELHAVLDIVVPGMLGPRAAFERAFGSAMSDGNRSAVGTLRQIVRPLVLRRTKSEVLSELPPKTEITRVIEPTPGQRAFYEATRRRALERVEAASGGGGHIRIQVLAEITRLRRAAIDPRLVGGPEAPTGAKIDALVELVTELREEGHRALVFSQFLEVLDFAAERLAEAKVSCRRLDGTMSAGARAKEVAAFQSGEGDVFLLSLKAGGVGMNLTGADFVVHLDPWWNPAVEDQATDRAHRIGQNRPVTIVRLVTGGTIEEKVLALHGVKRKLYEDVVGAADGAGPLDFTLLTDLLSVR